jgi:hypothetical protein
LAWAGFNVWAEAFALDLGLTKAIAVMDSIGVSQTKILYYGFWLCFLGLV